MEAGLNAYIKERLGVQNDTDIRSVSALSLAYIGDGVYELVLRTCMLARENAPAGRLQRQASSLARASAQSRMVDVILPSLTEEEKNVYRRGRNAKSGHVARSASVHDYRRATGFEALIGYLYLSDRMDRMMELIGLALRGYGRRLETGKGCPGGEDNE